MSREDIVKLFKENKVEDIASSHGRLKLSIMYNTLHNLPGFVGFSGDSFHIANCIKQTLGE
ncbi:hypothetical protein UT300012_23650 [Paraclostridium bifermentans]